MSGASIRLSSVVRRPHAALIVMVVVAVVEVLISGGAVAAKPRIGRGQASGEAPGRPGTQSYLDEARKDCFGTAHDPASKVWFTVADGVLSDVFSPTIENTNAKTVQYIVTDGRSFTALHAATVGSHATGWAQVAVTGA